MGKIEEGAEHGRVPDYRLSGALRYLPFYRDLFYREDQRVDQLHGALRDIEPSCDLVVQDKRPGRRVHRMQYLAAAAPAIPARRAHIMEIKRAEEDKQLPREHLAPPVLRLGYEVLDDAFQCLDMRVKGDGRKRKDLLLAEAHEPHKLFVELELSFLFL